MFKFSSEQWWEFLVAFSLAHVTQNVTCFGGGKSTLVYIAILYVSKVLSLGS